MSQYLPPDVHCAVKCCGASGTGCRTTDFPAATTPTGTDGRVLLTERIFDVEHLRPRLSAESRDEGGGGRASFYDAMCLDNLAS